MHLAAPTRTLAVDWTPNGPIIITIIITINISSSSSSIILTCTSSCCSRSNSTYTMRRIRPEVLPLSA